jgi:hypothetical protein
MSELFDEKTINPVETKPKGKSPEFKGDGVAVWVNKDKNGNKYLSIRLVGHNPVNAFLNEKKE